MSKEIESKKKNSDITPTKKKILKKGVSSEEEEIENESKEEKEEKMNKTELNKLKKKTKKGKRGKKRGRKKKDSDEEDEDEDEEFADEEKIDITKEDKSEDKTEDKTEDKKEVDKIEIVNTDNKEKDKENTDDIKKKDKNKDDNNNKKTKNDKMEIEQEENDNEKSDKENNNNKKENDTKKKNKEENNDKEEEVNDDNNKIVIEEDPEEENRKALLAKRRRGVRRRQLEEKKNEEIEQRKKDEKEKALMEDDDIISIQEEEEKIMNSNYEMKSDNNKYLNTPFGKLLQISQEYGFGTVMDKLISFINTNEPNTKYGVVGISKDLKDILKKLNKETLNLYLIKLLAYNQKKNFRILSEFKVLNDKKFAKYLKKIREDGDLDGGGDINFDEDEDSANTDEEKEKLSDEEEKKDDKVDRRRGTDLHDDVQYRSRHFQWKDGILHSYLPKINLKSMRCYLYCWKMGCRAKVRIDMINKTGIMYGTHTDHRGVILENFKDEYPELDTEGWEHIQYDVKNGKKILMWKN